MKEVIVGFITCLFGITLGMLIERWIDSLYCDGGGL